MISVLRFLNNLWEALSSLLEAWARARRAEREKRSGERNKAVDDFRNAKSEEEADEAMDRIVRNRPHP